MGRYFNIVLMLLHAHGKLTMGKLSPTF